MPRRSGSLWRAAAAWLVASLLLLTAPAAARRVPTHDDPDRVDAPRFSRAVRPSSADPAVDAFREAELRAASPPAQEFAAAGPGQLPVLTENRVSWVQLVGRWSPTGVVHGMAANLTIWRSGDSMMTWSATPITTQMSFMASSPANGSTVFFAANRPYTTSWVTRDNGQSYQIVNTPAPFVRLLFHPTDVNWALALGYSSSLFVTRDGGATWQSVVSSTVVLDFDWCGAGLGSMPKNQICILMNGNGPGQPAWRGRSLVVTTNFGSSFMPLLQQRVEYFLVHPMFIFALATDSTGSTDLWVCPVASGVLQFTPAVIPNGVDVERLAPEQLLDDSTGAVWLGVQTGPPSNSVPDHGDVYVSDTDGIKYTRVLQNVFQQTNWWDVEAVQSLPGVYLTNLLLNWQEEDATNNAAPPQLKTQVTFNMGRSWQYLTAPANDSLGNPIQCSGFCSLNLFGVTTWIGAGGYGFFGHFYSNPYATGLILATGNVGPYIDFRPWNVNTYMSRDGGLTWRELMKGSNVYEYGDFGGILVLVANQVLTNVAYYSLDEGLTFTAFNFTNNPVVVTNVWSTSATGKRFVISSARPGAPTRIYIGLDFTNIQENECTSADYELWSPPGGTCVLGRTVVYKRRKQTSYCWNDDSFNPTHVASSTNCNCNTTDYECDYGYVQSDSGQCLRDPTVTINQVCAPDGTTMVSSGYRRIPSDTCVNDLPGYTPTRQACTPPATASSTSGAPDSHGDAPGSSPGGWVVLGLFIGLVVGAAGGAVGFWRFKIWRNRRGSYRRADGMEEVPFLRS